MPNQAAKIEPIRALVVNDNPHICRALIRLLNGAADIEVVATATDELLTLVGRLSSLLTCVPFQWAQAHVQPSERTRFRDYVPKPQ